MTILYHQSGFLEAPFVRMLRMRTASLTSVTPKHFWLHIGIRFPCVVVKHSVSQNLDLI